MCIYEYMIESMHICIYMFCMYILIHSFIHVQRVKNMGRTMTAEDKTIKTIKAIRLRMSVMSY